MNSAYCSSLSLTSSSTRIWRLLTWVAWVVLLPVASTRSPFGIRNCQTSCLQAKLHATVRRISARPKHELRFRAARGGSDPRSPEGPGRDFAARWGRSRLSSCFGRVLVHPLLLVHLVFSSAAYVSTWVTLGVKSPAKGLLLTLFQGVFTKVLGCRSKSATWPFTGEKTNATV